MLPHLMRPQWLWCLLPVLVLALLLWRHRGRSGSWREVIAPELLPFLVGRQAGARTPELLPALILAWILAVLAASGPSWQKLPQPVHQKQDALVLVLDLSYSMKSGDLAPSRLDRARQKLLDLLAERREGQTGLIAYAGDAHIVTPLTDDTGTIANLLPALNPDMMPVPGSDPAAAVAQAVELLHSAGIRGGRILLVTDGIGEGDARAIEKALASSAAGFSVMGVGTATGAPIPLEGGGFLKDREGAIVMPGLDQQALRRLAEASGGRYRPIAVDNSDLQALLAESVLPGREPTLALDRTADAWEDQGYLLILLILPVVLALFRRGWVLCLLPLLLAAQPERALADGWDRLWLTPDQQGQRALQAGDNERAASLFEDPAWSGTAAYRSGDYDAAIESFSRSDSADGWYNRGNALARAGKLDEAIAAYRQSLELAPDRRDASENLELLEQLKRQQEQQQQDQGGDPSQNQDQHQGQQENDSQGGEQQTGDQQQGGEDQQQAGNEREQGGDRQQQAEQQSPQQGKSPEREQGRAPGSQDQNTSGEQADDREGQPGQPADRQETAEQPGDSSERQAAAAGTDPEQQERDQAVEQWLRRVPDDPSGLLREKFRYESYQRQQQGAKTDDETYW